MNINTDNDLLEKLKEENRAPFEILYKFYFPVVSSYIRQNKGNREDAEDIFQETIMVLFQKVRQPGFVLSSSLKTYIFSISRNLWLKRLRDNKLTAVDDFESYMLQGEPFEIEIVPQKTKEEKLTFWLSQVTEHCQRVLKAIFFHNQPMVKLMQKMGWKNKHTAANQQYKCIGQIKRLKDKEA